MQPPKCRICRVKAWDHSCGGAPSLSNIPEEAQHYLRKRNLVAGKPEKTLDRPVSTVDTPPAVTSVFTRSDAERVRKWRKENRARYNAYMRDWRKRKRAGHDS